jgi:hypothetical protein
VQVNGVLVGKDRNVFRAGERQEGVLAGELLKSEMARLAPEISDG